MRPDERIKFAERITRRMAGPWQLLVTVEHRHLRRGAGFGDDQIGARRSSALRHHEAAQILGLRDRGREADAAQLRCNPKQPGKAERQQVAALRCDERMEFVENDAPKRAKQIRRIGRGEKKRELLRRRQQHVRRMTALTLAF